MIRKRISKKGKKGQGGVLSQGHESRKGKQRGVLETSFFLRSSV